MELQEFVRETLKQIVDGVREAKDYGATKDAEINPISLFAGASNLTTPVPTRTLPDGGYRIAQTVAFDVAITIVEESEKQGGGKLQVLGISAGGEKKSNQSSSTVSRVQFTVPVFLP